jgi:beta-N-acetylhexosaminidase
LKAAILGVAGTVLGEDEAALFRARPPAGVILFRRNVEDPGQLRALNASLRQVLPRGAVIMVDQEGGRVARLRSPHWRAHPPAGQVGALCLSDRQAGLRAAWLCGALIGADCAAAGFDTVCAPVLDLLYPGRSDVVGDRSFGADPEDVAALGRAMAEGLFAAGVQPVAKHAPGHGRAETDSHHALPVVRDAELERDFIPFARNADLPWLMTAHILYERLDPSRPATLSRKIIQNVIRERIGFRGVLVSDDLTMRALEGEPGDLARETLAAGCDLALHCSGELAAGEAVLQAVPDVTAEAARRMQAARARAEASRVALDADALAAERDRLLA